MYKQIIYLQEALIYILNIFNLSYSTLSILISPNSCQLLEWMTVKYCRDPPPR